MQKTFELELKKIDELTVYLIKLLQNDDYIVILRGDLASGKTTLVKNYVKKLNLDDLVTSPTFSLQAVYSSNIFHYDQGFFYHEYHIFIPYVSYMELATSAHNYLVC